MKEFFLYRIFSWDVSRARLKEFDIFVQTVQHYILCFLKISTSVAKINSCWNNMEQTNGGN